MENEIQNVEDHIGKDEARRGGGAPKVALYSELKLQKKYPASVARVNADFDLTETLGDEDNVEALLRAEHAVFCLKTKTILGEARQPLDAPDDPPTYPDYDEKKNLKPIFDFCNRKERRAKPVTLFLCYETENEKLALESNLASIQDHFDGKDIVLTPNIVIRQAGPLTNFVSAGGEVLLQSPKRAGDRRGHERGEARDGGRQQPHVQPARKVANRPKPKHYVVTLLNHGTDPDECAQQIHEANRSSSKYEYVHIPLIAGEDGKFDSAKVLAQLNASKAEIATLSIINKSNITKTEIVEKFVKETRVFSCRKQYVTAELKDDNAPESFIGKLWKKQQSYEADSYIAFATEDGLLTAPLPKILQDVENIKPRMTHVVDLWKEDNELEEKIENYAKEKGKFRPMTTPSSLDKIQDGDAIVFVVRSNINGNIDEISKLTSALDDIKASNVDIIILSRHEIQLPRMNLNLNYHGVKISNDDIDYTPSEIYKLGQDLHMRPVANAPERRRPARTEELNYATLEFPSINLILAAIISGGVATGVSGIVMYSISEYADPMLFIKGTPDEVLWLIGGICGLSFVIGGVVGFLIADKMHEHGKTPGKESFFISLKKLFESESMLGAKGAFAAWLVVFSILAVGASCTALAIQNVKMYEAMNAQGVPIPDALEPSSGVDVLAPTEIDGVIYNTPTPLPDATPSAPNINTVDPILVIGLAVLGAVLAAAIATYLANSYGKKGLIVQTEPKDEVASRIKDGRRGMEEVPLELELS